MLLEAVNLSQFFGSRQALDSVNAYATVAYEGIGEARLSIELGRPDLSQIRSGQKWIVRFEYAE